MDKIVSLLRVYWQSKNDRQWTASTVISKCSPGHSSPVCSLIYSHYVILTI